MLITIISFFIVMFVLSVLTSIIVGNAPVKPFAFNSQSGVKIVLSPLVTSLRGKLGNGIAQVWKGIQTFRQMPAVITNPQSAAQSAIRTMMGNAKAAWTALTVDNKATWDEMALLVKDYEMPPGGINQLVPPLGGPMSGFNCFVSFYMAAVGVGSAAPTSAPLSEQRPGAPTNVAVAFVLSRAEITWTDPTIKESGAKYRVWLRSEGGIYHRQFRAYGDMLVQTLSLGTARAAKGADLEFAIPETAGNERLYVQMDVVNPSGLRSMGSNVPSVLLA